MVDRISSLIAASLVSTRSAVNASSELASMPNAAKASSRPASLLAFAKYDGVDGESQDANHDGWVNISGYEWGAERPGNATTGQTRRRAAAVIDDFVVTFDYEKASPKLLEKALRGEIIPKLEIELTAVFGGDRVTYLRYELTNVMVTSYQVGGTADGSPPTVDVSHNFEEVKVTYTEYDSEGNPLGNIETTYDAGKGQ